MKLSGWHGIVGILCVIVAGIVMVGSLRHLQSEPQPSTTALRQMAGDIGARIPGASVSSPLVVEKAFFINVRVEARTSASAPSLAGAVGMLKSGGFSMYKFDEGRLAILCKGETAAEMHAYPPEGANPGLVLISITWGTGSAVCR